MIITLLHEHKRFLKKYSKQAAVNCSSSSSNDNNMLL